MADDDWEDVTSPVDGGSEWEDVTSPARLATTDAGPEARRAAAGLPPGPRDVQFEPRGPEFAGSAVTRRQGYPGGLTAEEVQASALQSQGEAEEQQGMAAAGAVGGELGTIVSKGLGPLLGARISGTYGALVGGGSSAVLSGAKTPREIATGAAAGVVLSRLMSGAASRVARREIEQPFKEYARKSNTYTQEKLTTIGPQETARVIQKYQLGSINKPQVAAAAIEDGLKQAGAARSDAFLSVQRAGGDVDMGAVAKALDKLQERFASSARTRQFAGDVAELRTDMLKRYGDKGRISPQELTDEISGVREGAYGGKYLDPKLKVSVQRQTGGVLKGVLDEHMNGVVKRNPLALDAVRAVHEANRDFAVLKTLKPVVTKAAVQDKLKLSMLERFQQRPPTMGQVALAPVRAAVGGVAAPFRAADIALAKLFQLRQSGSPITPEALAGAASAGVDPRVMAQFGGQP